MSIKNTYEITVVGATSDIAQSYIDKRYETLSKNYKYININLIARNKKKLNLLKKKYKDHFYIIKLYKIDLKTIDDKFVNCLKNISFDEILIAQGQLTDQNKLLNNLNYIKEDLNVNLLSYVVIINLAVKKINQQKKGKLIILGSVAGDLGKKTNFTYSYTKAAIQNYIEGVQHKNPNFEIYLIKPGLTKTKMTKNFNQSSFLWSKPEKVAKDIDSAIKRKKPIIFSPWWWKYILFFLKILPWFIFKKIKM
jgi:decaprenylphospho-beta-D-erythro-pentofuranosid-2-ulose 2-reductase